MNKIIQFALTLAVGLVIGYVANSGQSFQGISHLSGLAVGQDGLSTENGGTAAFASTTSSAGQLKTDGGVLDSSVNSTSTVTATYTLVQADVRNYSTILFTPNISTTLTLPATTSLDGFVPTAGDQARITIVNASTTSGIITIAGGTGTLLRKATTTATILPNSIGILTFVRKANTDILVFFDNAVQ